MLVGVACMVFGSLQIVIARLRLRCLLQFCHSDRSWLTVVLVTSMITNRHFRTTFAKGIGIFYILGGGCALVSYF